MSISKPILMIHEIREDVFKLPLDQYVLTFDDGLFGQYAYLEKILKINTTKYFFISTNIICPENTSQNQHLLKCREAHERFFNNGDLTNYMKWGQIKEISKEKNCHIGGHSHRHQKYDLGKIGLRKLFDELTIDTNKMISSFRENDLDIKSFCFPYNKEYPLYKEILRKNQITLFFGNERIPVENLLESTNNAKDK